MRAQLQCTSCVFICIPCQQDPRHLRLHPLLVDCTCSQWKKNRVFSLTNRVEKDDKFKGFYLRPARAAESSEAASRRDRSSLSRASALTWSPYSSSVTVGGAMCDPSTPDLTVSRLKGQ